MLKGGADPSGSVEGQMEREECRAGGQVRSGHTLPRGMFSPRGKVPVLGGGGRLLNGVLLYLVVFIFISFAMKSFQYTEPFFTRVLVTICTHCEVPAGSPAPGLFPLPAPPPQKTGPQS